MQHMLIGLWLEFCEPNWTEKTNWKRDLRSEKGTGLPLFIGSSFDSCGHKLPLFLFGETLMKENDSE